MKTLIRIIAMLALVAGSLVACGNSSPVCAATGPKPPPAKPIKPQQPRQQRTTSKVQDRPNNQPKATKKPAAKPTNWGGYNDRVAKRSWTSPYRKGYPTAPQPVIIHQHGSDYRTYPGYTGYYPVGVWPSGYGSKYGCSADQEGSPVR